MGVEGESEREPYQLREIEEKTKRGRRHSEKVGLGINEMETRESKTGSEGRKSFIKILPGLSNLARSNRIAALRQRSTSLESSTCDELQVLREMKAAGYISTRPDRFIIHPYSTLRARWDVLGLLFAMWTITCLPLQLCFEKFTDLGPDLSTFVCWMNVIADIIFALDLIVNTRTGVDLDGQIVMKSREILKNYMHPSKFLVDLVSSFPVQYLVKPATVPGLTYRLLLSLKLLRIVRFARISKRFEYNFSLTSTESSLGKFVFVVFIMVHWSSCIFGALEFGLQGETLTLHELGDSVLSEQYVTALYWATMTMTTVGFGDVGARTTSGRTFSVVIMFLGASLFAYGVTNVVQMIAQLDNYNVLYRQKMDEINRYMEARDLPQSIRQDIREYFHHTQKAKQTPLKNEGLILRELSKSLRGKVALAVHEQYLASMPYFEGCDPMLVMELVLCMHMVCYPKGEMIIRENEYGNTMYFIYKGTVEILRKDVRILQISKGQFFGESSLISEDRKRAASARALEFCELRALTRHDFENSLKKHPNLGIMVNKMTASKLHESRRNYGRTLLECCAIRTERTGSCVSEDEGNEMDNQDWQHTHFKQYENAHEDMVFEIKKLKQSVLELSRGQTDIRMHLDSITKLLNGEPAKIDRRSRPTRRSMV